MGVLYPEGDVMLKGSEVGRSTRSVEGPHGGPSRRESQPPLTGLAWCRVFLRSCTRGRQEGREGPSSSARSMFGPDFPFLDAFSGWSAGTKLFLVHPEGYFVALSGCGRKANEKKSLDLADKEDDNERHEIR